MKSTNINDFDYIHQFIEAISNAILQGNYRLPSEGRRSKST
jgi:hypothetical protein